MAVYLCTAMSSMECPTMKEPAELLEYARSLTYYEKVPTSKLVVGLVDDGSYIAHYGPIVNPVEGDYSTGSIDQDNMRVLY